jgi:hypothetical protein
MYSRMRMRTTPRTPPPSNDNIRGCEWPESLFLISVNQHINKHNTIQKIFSSSHSLIHWFIHSFIHSHPYKHYLSLILHIQLFIIGIFLIPIGMNRSSWIGQNIWGCSEHDSQNTWPHFNILTGRFAVNVLKHAIQNDNDFVIKLFRSSDDFRCNPSCKSFKFFSILWFVFYNSIKTINP